MRSYVKLGVLLLSALALASCDKKDKKEAAPASVQEQAPQNEANQNPDPNTNPQTPPPATNTVDQLKYPLVFHHGFMTGGEQKEGAELANAVKPYGVSEIYYTNVSPANTVEERATEMAAQIDEILAETNADKVNIVAHSIGGLDARYLISSMGYEDRVASLSTVSTPHRGTPVADSFLLIPQDMVESVIDSIYGFTGTLLGQDESDQDRVDALSVIEDLTPEYMEDTFNPANPDSDQVYYQSWGGTSGFGTGHGIKPVLYPTGAYLSWKAGKNDGIVPTSSAQWGEYKGDLKADHIDLSSREISLLGGDGFAFPKFIELVAKELAEKGY